MLVKVIAHGRFIAPFGSPFDWLGLLMLGLFDTSTTALDVTGYRWGLSWWRFLDWFLVSWMNHENGQAILGNLGSVGKLVFDTAIDKQRLAEILARWLDGLYTGPSRRRPVWIHYCNFWCWKTCGAVMSVSTVWPPSIQLWDLLAGLRSHHQLIRGHLMHCVGNRTLTRRHASVALHRGGPRCVQSPGGRGCRGNPSPSERRSVAARVYHRNHISILELYGDSLELKSWIWTCLCFQVRKHTKHFSTAVSLRGAPQGAILAPLFFALDATDTFWDRHRGSLGGTPMTLEHSTLLLCNYSVFSVRNTVQTAPCLVFEPALGSLRMRALAWTNLATLISWYVYDEWERRE